MLKEIEDEKLAQWLNYMHFIRFEKSDIMEISEKYLGVYSNHPTSWLSVLARNRNKKFEEAIMDEKNEEMVRIPAMRRSKFILPESLALLIFNATRLSISEHEWRLKEVDLTLDAYNKSVLKLKEITKDKALKLNEIKDIIGLTSKQISAIVKVAAYMGTVIRVPSDNAWSNRWLYKSSPSKFEQVNKDKKELEVEIAQIYVENYGPVTVKDLSWWLGISKKRAFILMEKINAVKVDEENWMTKEKKDEFLKYDLKVEEDKAIRFLPDWDPLLMGYAPDSKARRCIGLYDINAYDSRGNGCPVVFISGKAIALWKVAKVKNKRVMNIKIINNKYDKYRDQIEKAAKEYAERIGVIYKEM